MTMRIFVLAALITAASSLAAAEQPAMKVKEEKAGLLAQAKVKPDAAMKLAQAQVPAGTIQSAEIETEDGVLIYSFEIKTAGRSGIDEVNVNASTGKVLPVEHESPDAESTEKAPDSVKPQSRP